MKTIRLFMLVLSCALASVVSNAQVDSAKTKIRYLSGTGKDDAVIWDFFCTGGRKSGVWTRIRVPSCWETEGFGDYQYGGDRQRETKPFPKEQGKYRLTQFEIPAAWKGRIVRLVFDGSMTDTEVWVNGKSAGPIHQGSFYRFKFDITPLLKFGESNLLEVTVSKVSSNESVNRAERLGDYWNFGGIFRPVFLEALPPRFIDWTAIDARADGSFSVDVHLPGVAAADKISAQIVDASGASIGPPFVADISPNQDVVKLQTRIAAPKLWTAETPNLYRVRISLFRKRSACPFGHRAFRLPHFRGQTGRRLLPERTEDPAEGRQPSFLLARDRAHAEPADQLRRYQADQGNEHERGAHVSLPARCPLPRRLR